MKKFVDFTTGSKNEVFGKDFYEKKNIRIEKRNFCSPRNFFLKKVPLQKKLFNKQEVFKVKQQLLPIYLQKKTLVIHRNSFLFTLSGGQDSILTLFLLLHTKNKECSHIVYCQHFWQLKNFFSARLIFQLSYLVQIPYTVTLPQTAINTENESREWRKKLFFRFSKMEQILTTFTGHSETDELERNLNNLFRGTSPATFFDLNLLTSQNRSDIFFSNININTCFFTKLLEPRNILRKFETTKKQKTQSVKKVSVGPENCVFGNGKDLHRHKKNKTTGPKKLFLGKGFVTKLDFPLNDPKNGVFGNTFGYSKQKKFKSFKSRNDFKHLSGLIMTNLDQQKVRKVFPKTEFLEKKTFGKKLLINERSTKTLKKSQFYQFPSTYNHFSFFYCTKHLSKNHPNRFFTLLNSFSFCFSNRFLGLRVNLSKPLTKTTRFSVSKLVYLYKLPVLVDVTNFSSTFSRNKIRHQFIPFSRSLLNPNSEYLVTNFFKLLHEENENKQKELAELFFVSKLFNFHSCKKRTNLLIRSNSIFKTKSLGNKLVQRYFFVSPNQNAFDFNSLRLKTNCLSFGNQEVKEYSTKRFFNSVSGIQTRSFIQKLFIEYKNLSLNSLQLIQLESFNKKMTGG